MPSTQRFFSWRVRALWIWILAGLLVTVVAAALWPVPLGGGRSSPTTTCLSNVKQLGIGILIYTTDYDDRLPRADTWYDVDWPYLKREFRCPLAPPIFNGATAVGYAFNSSLEMAPTLCIDKPAKTVLVYDSANLLRNATDPVTSLVVGGRHKGGNNVAYLDSHARRIMWPDSPGVTRPQISEDCRRTGRPGNPSPKRRRP